MLYLFFALLTVVELVLFVMLLSFFRRLQRSEQLLTELQTNQDSILDKLEINAGLEQELMRSFTQRQEELFNLDRQLEERIQELRRLVEQADAASHSPQFLREIILAGQRKGRSAAQLARDTGLSIDEVELILAQNRN